MVWLFLIIVGIASLAALGHERTPPDVPTVIYIERPAEFAHPFGGCFPLAIGAVALLFLLLLVGEAVGVKP